MSLLLRRSARTHWAALLVLGLLVLVTSFLAGAGPRTLVATHDRAVREALTTAPAGSTDLVATAQISPVAPQGERIRARFPSATDQGFASQGTQWLDLLPQTLRDTIVTTDRNAATPFLGLTGVDSGELSLGFSGTVNGHIRYVSGHAPGAPKRTAHGLRFETALPVRAAGRLRVKAGDDLTTLSQPALLVRVTGLFTPTDPGSAYWPAHRRYEDAELEKLPSGQIIILATGLVGPAGYEALYTRTPFRIDLTWTYTPGVDRVTARIAPELVDDVQRAAEALPTIRIDSAGPALDTQFDDVLADFVRRLRATETLLSLSFAGLFAAALGVLALATRLLLTRMGAGLAVQAARGASWVHLTGLAAGLAALVTLPAALLGLALSALMPGPAQPVSYAAVAVLAVTVIGLPAVVAGRRPARRSRPTYRRFVAEALVVVLAVAGIVLLRRRGLTTETSATGIDPFLSAVPALLSVATGLLVLRLLPLPLRLAGRILARGRSAAPFVGVARASRQDATAVLPLVVLVLAVTVIGFGGAVQASLARTQRVATYESVGGDARADVLSMDRAVIDRVRHSPGVRAAVPAQTIDTARLLVDGDLVDDLTAVGVDLDAYRQMMAGTGMRVPAWPRTRPGDPVPALFSPAASRKARSAGLALSTDYGQRIPLRDVGTIARFPGRQAGGEFVLVPADALSRATGGGNVGSVSIFVRGEHIDVAALRRNSAQPALGDAGASSVSTYRMTHDAFAQGELGRLVGRSFDVAGFLVAGYGTLAVLVILFAGARARGRTVSYLRTLGLSRRQARSLAFVEIAPTLFAASVAGWLLGLALPVLLGPAIDLRPYTGGFPVSHYVPDLAQTAALAGGLLVFAGLAVLIDAVTAARRGLGGVLRIGEI